MIVYALEQQFKGVYELFTLHATHESALAELMKFGPYIHNGQDWDRNDYYHLEEGEIVRHWRISTRFVRT